jgi:protein-S-isoprenylcysteine O-methyltransferase Ste14
VRWVVAQFALMVLTAVSWLIPPRFPDGALDFLGGALALVGFALAAWAYHALGAAFTPFPQPRGERVTRGPYRYLRHPMYLGGVLVFGGMSLIFSVPGLVLTAALALLWWRKGRLEERLLIERG